MMAPDCVDILGCSYYWSLEGIAIKYRIHEGQVYKRQRYRKDFWSLVVTAGIQQDCGFSLPSCLLFPFFFNIILLSFLGFPLAGICQRFCQFEFHSVPLLITSLFSLLEVYSQMVQNV